MNQKNNSSEFISQNSNLLVIESAFSKSSVGLYQAGKIEVIEGNENLKHSDYLLENLNQLLTKNSYLANTSKQTKKTKLKKLDAIITSNGPGSFTALRVGATVSKALAYTLNLAIIPISSLTSITQSALKKLELSAKKNNIIISLMDARVRGIYASVHQVIQNDNHHSIQKIGKEKLIELKNLKDYLTQNLTNQSSPETNYFLVGNAFLIYQSEMEKELTQLIEQKFKNNLTIKKAKIEALIELALKQPKSLWQDGLSFELNYLRNQVADLPKLKK